MENRFCAENYHESFGYCKILNTVKSVFLLILINTYYSGDGSAQICRVSGFATNSSMVLVDDPWALAQQQQQQQQHKQTQRSVNPTTQPIMLEPATGAVTNNAYNSTNNMRERTTAQQDRTRASYGHLPRVTERGRADKHDKMLPAAPTMQPFQPENQTHAPATVISYPPKVSRAPQRRPSQERRYILSKNPRRVS